jgi:hypothetical protein
MALARQQFSASITVTTAFGFRKRRKAACKRHGVQNAE